MLIKRIQLSMNRVLEGVDRCEPRLILEATKEFEAATDALKKDVEGFVAVIKNIKELEGFYHSVSGNCFRILDDIDFNDISDEYSFTDHYKMMHAPSRKEGTTNPEHDVAWAATNYPAYVNGLKNGIMVIAKWAEQFPEVFSVGQKGIMFQKAFGEIVSAKNPELRIKDMCGADQMGILKAMSGADNEDEIKDIFKSIWLPEGTEKEKEDEAWTKFTGGIEKIGQAGKAAYDQAAKEISDTEPPKEVQQSGNQGGGFLKTLLGSILGEGTEEQTDMGYIAEQLLGQSLEGDDGLFAMTFTGLQELITKVIAFAQSSAKAGAQALKAVDAQTQETMKPKDNQNALWDLFNKSELKMKQEDITMVGAALETAGWKKDTEWTKLDKDKVQESLMKAFKNDEDKTKAVMDLLYGESSEGSANEDVIDELKAEIEDLDISDDFNDGLQKLIDELIDDDGVPVEKLKPEEVKSKIEDVAPEGEELPDDITKELIDLVADVNVEENLYRRWSRLAGILKD